MRVAGGLAGARYGGGGETFATEPIADPFEDFELYHFDCGLQALSDEVLKKVNFEFKKNGKKKSQTGTCRTAMIIGEVMGGVRRKAWIRFLVLKYCCQLNKKTGKFMVPIFMSLVYYSGGPISYTQKIPGLVCYTLKAIGIPYSSSTRKFSWLMIYPKFVIIFGTHFITYQFWINHQPRKFPD